MSEITSRLSTAVADRYKLERHLGEGGMATVYLAHDLKHDRKVALKVLKPELAAVIGAERFLNEIKVTANLQHPNILSLYDSGEADAFLYYVMPFVEGESLRDTMNREKQLGIDETVEIAKAVCGAIDYAHDQGVIHRDIKPENILLQRGQPVVADFGIALAVSQAGGSRLTETGLSLGTPQYMSPEQATGDRQLDGRSDIYSLAAVLYEMLTGEPPFSGPTVQAIIAKILTGRPRPLLELRGTTPAHVAAAIDRGLASLPADRFHNGNEFAHALINPLATSALTYEVQTGDAQQARPRRGSASRLLLLGGIAAAAVLGFVAGSQFGGSEGDGIGSRTVSLTVPVTSLQIDAVLGQLPLMALSPDGQSLVLAHDGMLHVRPFDRFTTIPLIGTEGAAAPAFSPDGQWLVFNQRGRIRRVAAVGGQIVDVASANFRLGAFWGEDDYIYYSAGLGDRGIWRVPAGGGQPEQLTQLSDSIAEQAHGWPQVIPGTNDLLYTVLGPSGGAEDSRIVVQPIGGGTSTTLVDQAVFGRFIATGHILFGKLDGAVFAVPYDRDQRAVTGARVAVFDGVTVAVWGGGTLFAVSDQGTMVAALGTATENHVLELVDRDGLLIRRIGEPGNLRGAMLSPTSSQIAVTDRVPGRNDVVLRDLEGSGSLRFTLAQPEDEMPVWSPDGRTIAYTSAWSGEARRVMVKSASEGTDAEIALTWPRHVHLTSWSPDGQWWAAYDYHTANNEDVWALSTDGSDSIAVATTAAAELNAVFSPDGRWLAYQSEESGRFEVYVRSFPSLSVYRAVSNNGGRVPRWGSGGRTLYYLEGDKLMTVAVAAGDNFETIGAPTPLFTTAAFDYDVTSDGNRILLMLQNPDATASPIHVVVNWFSELLRLVSVAAS